MFVCAFVCFCVCVCVCVVRSSSSKYTVYIFKIHLRTLVIKIGLVRSIQVYIIYTTYIRLLYLFLFHCRFCYNLRCYTV